MAVDRVRVVSGAALTTEVTASTIMRRHAVSEPELWTGLSSIGPGVETGWHHHGTNTTVFYVLSGSLLIEYGSPVESAIVTAGDFAVVPPGVVHREIVPPATGIEAVVVRFGDGSGPLVVEVEGPEG